MVLKGARDLLNIELKKRIITGIFLVLFLVAPLFYFDLSFFAIPFLVYFLSLAELFLLSYRKSFKVFLFGSFYIILSFLGLLIFTFVLPDKLMFVTIEGINAAGNAALLNIFIIMWLSDTSGYVFGKMIGGPKFIPSISPNKTWAGTIAAVFLPLFVFHFLSGGLSHNQAAVIIIISSAVVFGDLVESKIKRLLGVKNSGKVLPGHGGFFDRFDGLIGVGFCLFLVFLFIITLLSFGISIM